MRHPLSPVPDGLPRMECFSRSLDGQFHILGRPDNAHDTKKDNVMEQAVGQPVGSVREMNVPLKIFSPGKSAGTVAMQLLYDSWLLLKRLQLDDWEVDNYALVVKKLQKKDPFLHRATAHALQYFQPRRIYEAPVLDTDFMAAPLMALLAAPDKDVLHRLPHWRYATHAIVRAHLWCRQDPLTIDTHFLTEVSEIPAEVIAWRLTENALHEFRQLSNRSVIR
ncbi:uncharacterized protein BDW43DRAFT_307929 [Aspergillus alliaceus]|uniref:uncharacterized protein n=1 Tax=Petromyces alliaceus TaxID=209559 RepID=UPI0012A5BF2B|nr:uncharacterized protein BDW43DRAFT_307929 [Aspergillus alliaceus]KAB8236911.1 hypothetical protein BDW43DRAFT_307929 [Aspergillus alliaceus]